MVVIQICESTPYVFITTVVMSISITIMYVNVDSGIFKV